MIVFRRFLPFIGSAIVLGFYLGLTFRPSEWIYWVCAIIGYAIVSSLFMLRWDWRGLEFLTTAFPLLLFLGSATGVFMFIPSQLWRMILVLGIIIVHAVYMENVFTLHYQSSKYTSLSLPRLTVMMNTISVFLIATGLLAVDLVAPMQDWLIVLLLAIVFTILLFQMLYQFSVYEKKKVGSVLLIALFLAQIVWAVQFLPTAFFVNGAYIAICWYAFSSIYLQYERHALTTPVLLQYSIISSMMIALISATAQWT